MDTSKKQTTPFVFQIAAALREFELQHGGEKSVDFSIGTPPTSPTIRAKQMELILGTAENPFTAETMEAFLYHHMEKMVFNMGKYEAVGGRREFRERFGPFKDGFGATIISGGVPKTLELWGNLQHQFGNFEVVVSRNFADMEMVGENKIIILSTAFMERSSLALFCGPDTVVEALRILHTSLLGTPAAPQEDLYFLLSDKSVQEFLESGKIFEDDPTALTEIFEFLSLLYREPLKNLYENGFHLRKIFAKQFLNCFFQELIDDPKYKITTGNGGGRQALHIIEDFLTQQGVENMLLFQPHWTYANVYTRTKLISLPTTIDGEPDFEILEKKIAELTNNGQKRNTAITINSPNNPTGILYSREILEKLLKLCEKYQVFPVDDACYIFIVRKEEKSIKPLINVADEMVKKGDVSKDFLKKIFVALTASKGLGMAGARLGAILYRDENFTEVAEEHYSHELANLMALFLANALTFDRKTFQSLLQIINEEVDQRVEKVTSILNAQGISYRKPVGAFYLEMKVPFLKGKVDEMKNFALKMAHEKGIAFMPMEVFGGEKFAIRLSFGGEKSLTQLQEEMEILVTNLRAYKS